MLPPCMDVSKSSAGMAVPFFALTAVTVASVTFPLISFREGVMIIGFCVTTSSFCTIFPAAVTALSDTFTFPESFALPPVSFSV